jgi:hypothetical protein
VTEGSQERHGAYQSLTSPDYPSLWHDILWRDILAYGAISYGTISYGTVS